MIVGSTFSRWRVWRERSSAAISTKLAFHEIGCTVTCLGGGGTRDLLSFLSGRPFEILEDQT